MKAKVLTTALLIAATALLGGCGPTGDSTTNTGANPAGNAGGPAAAAKPSCDLAPASLVNETLGTHVGDPQVQDLSTVVVCRYSATAGNTGAVVVRMQTGMSAATFTTSRTMSDSNGIPTADLPGFQDQAYTSTLKAGSIVTNTVVALKGNIQILVSSPASFDAEKDLETKLYAKLT